MVESEERINNETTKPQNFDVKHNFILLAKSTIENQIECLLLSDMKLKEHFIIYYDKKGFHRKDNFCANEFQSKEKEINSEITSGFKAIFEVFEEQFFFTEKSEGRHFDQIAKILCEEFELEENK